MASFGELWRRLKFLLHRQQFERDLESEMKLHKQLRQEEYRNLGIGQDSAWYKKQRRFGNDTLFKEFSREVWGWGWLEKFAWEVRYALRTLGRSPRFTIVAILTLALGIGAATATFSLFDSIVLRPLGYRNPEQLYGIYFYLPRLAQQFPRLFVNGHNVVAWRQQSKAFSELTAFVYRDWTLISAGEPERLHGCRTTVNFFSVLGVRPILGRDFSPEEDVNGHEHVVLINEGYWHRRFGADPSILGKKINLDGRLYEVIGVIPADFAFPHTLTLEAFGGRDRHVDFWKPMAFDQWETDPPFGPMEFEAIARLTPGYTPEQGRDELNRISKAISKGDPNASEIEIRIAPLKDNIIGGAKQSLMILHASCRHLQSPSGFTRRRPGYFSLERLPSPEQETAHDAPGR